MMEIQKSKFKNQKFNLKFKIFYFLLAILTFNFCILTLPTYAAESTPSADIISKLKAFQKEAASKAAQLKDLITRKLQNKAYIGNVQSQSGNSLTLAVASGPKIVSINEDTVFDSNVKGKKYSNKKIAGGDFVAALGDVDETGVLTAKKIILEASPSGEPKTYLWGKVISNSDDLVTLRDNNRRNIAVSLTKSSKLKLNDIVILTGAKSQNIFEVEFVYIVATRSAKIN